MQKCQTELVKGIYPNNGFIDNQFSEKRSEKVERDFSPIKVYIFYRTNQIFLNFLVNVTWLYKIFSNTRCGGEGTKQNYLTRSKQKFFSLFSFYPLSPSTWLRFFFLMSFLMVVRSKSTWNRRLLELNMNL